MERNLIDAIKKTYSEKGINYIETKVDDSIWVHSQILQGKISYYTLSVKGNCLNSEYIFEYLDNKEKIKGFKRVTSINEGIARELGLNQISAKLIGKEDSKILEEAGYYCKEKYKGVKRLD